MRAAQRLAERIGATVIDIWFSPGSRHAQWLQPALIAQLGRRYVHVVELGNENYATPSAGIKIHDMERGIARLLDLTEPLILLCACERAACCHRTVIAGELRGRGHQVEELTSWDGLSQISFENLFEVAEMTQ
ncbi:MAG TPA: hypothetical protein VJZ91_09010 [Blastocatellia bacterium]|nr:hypothetical protein [Blastocatellia bacterium]